MSRVLRNVAETYHYLTHELSDPRTRNHDVILNPILITLLLVLYYKVVKTWGPNFMEMRRPFNIDKILIVYNIGQILVSAFLAIQSIRIVWWSGYYSLKCQPLSTLTTPIEMDIIRYIKYYYWVKIIDLLDTVFFVMRKKFNQVSFLHVYHHTAMIVLGYMTLKYMPGGHGVLLGTINCIVHTVMYTYYLLTTINPEYKKSIWWKKHLTQLQLLQFVILFVHFTQVLFRPSCTYPKWVSLAFIPQNTFMIYMFSDFYYKEYIKKKQQ